MWKLRSLGLGIAAGVLYGLFLRLAAEFGVLREIITVMSIAFLSVGPFAIGWLSIRRADDRVSALQAFFFPFIPILLGSLAAMLFQLEGMICFVMYLPAGFFFAGLGGLVARSMKAQAKSTVLAVMIMPFAVHWGEGRLQYKTEEHLVRNSVEIAATPAQVWNEIKSVRTITSQELQDSWVHKMGFPRPLDAEINQESVGGIRLARFERGLVFNETVYEWVPESRLAFRIDVDPKDIPPGALDDHVTIGGPFFDVLNGAYTIETKPDGGVVLHLESQFRLSTHFNWYAEIWTDMIMHRIQQDILNVVKTRSTSVSQAAN